MGVSINQLPSSDIERSDQLPFFSSANGQDRRTSVYQLAEALATIPITPDNSRVFTVDAITSVDAITLELANNDVVIANGRTTAGDGGGGTFRYVAASTQTVDNVIVFTPLAGFGRLFREFSGEIYAQWGGAKFDGVTDDTAALNRCLDAAGLLGGGKVICPQGTASLSDSNPGATNWDNNRALYMQYNNIVLEGQGEGTILQLANGADCHVIKIGQRVGGSSVTPIGCQVRQLKINGNRANQSTPTATDDHWDGVSVSSGCNNTRLQNLFISQVQYYGIGFQRNGFKDCTVAQVVIEDTGADGIDCKDDDGSSAGNVMFDVTVRRFGLVDKSILPLQAGINPRGGWAVSSVTVEDYASDRMGIRFESNVLAVNSRGSSCTDFVCRPSSSVETIGLMVNSGSFDYQTTVQGGRVFGGLLGVDFRVPRARASDISVDGAATGFQFTSEGTCTNLFAINCATTGYKFRSPGLTSVINGSARACGVGATFDSGADDCLLQGGRFSNNTTNISDSATGTQILNVAGIKTESRRAVAFAVTSVTEVTVTIPHGLAFTPALDSVVLSLQRDTVVTDYVIAYLNAYLTDATNVYCKVRITTASATGGATAKLLAFVVVKNGRN